MKKILKEILAIIFGALFFFLLGRFVATAFGPVPGVFSGLIGHFMIDFSYEGMSSVWWSWVVSSAVCGFFIGFFARRFKIKSGVFDKADIIRFNIIQGLVNLAVWVVIAPVLDLVIYGSASYKDSFIEVFKQGAVSAGVNIVTTAVVGTLLCISYAASAGGGYQEG